MITQSIVLALGLSAVASASLIPSGEMQFFARTDTCSYGPDMEMVFTADDSAKLFMCGSATPLSTTTLATAGLSKLNLVQLPGNRCDDFIFEVRNVKLSSGLALVLRASGRFYAAVGSDTPQLGPGVNPLKAYAGWAIGDCSKFVPSPDNEAVFVKSLVNEGYFPLLAKRYGAYPLGVQDGFVYENGLQCIVIKNYMCGQ